MMEVSNTLGTWWIFKSYKDALVFANANNINPDSVEKLCNNLARIIVQ